MTNKTPPIPQEEPKEHERWDYNRLKALEEKGIQEYRDMRAAPALSEEALVSFINQLSQWNLKTTGVEVLKAYLQRSTAKEVLEAELALLHLLDSMIVSGKISDEDEAVILDKVHGKICNEEHIRLKARRAQLNKDGGTHDHSK